MFTDAHFHSDDLSACIPDVAAAYRDAGTVGLASVHDTRGLERTRSLMENAGRYYISFGIHPQLPVMDEAGNLSTLAASGQIDAIGECGFDFFGDTPERIRTPENERTQSDAFELQLELAERHALPLVLHLRKADDLLFRYAARLARLRAVILHSWGGPAHEAEDFLKRCPRALFSFGTPVRNGNRKVAACVSALPLSAIVTETDAPYQPPRRLVVADGKERWIPERAYSIFTDLGAVVVAIASLRNMQPEFVMNAVADNFAGVFSNAV